MTQKDQLLVHCGIKELPAALHGVSHHVQPSPIAASSVNQRNVLVKQVTTAAQDRHQQLVWTTDNRQVTGVSTCDRRDGSDARKHFCRSVQSLSSSSSVPVSQRLVPLAEAECEGSPRLHNTCVSQHYLQHASVDNHQVAWEDTASEFSVQRQNNYVSKESGVTYGSTRRKSEQDSSKLGRSASGGTDKTLLLDVNTPDVHTTPSKSTLLRTLLQYGKSKTDR